MYFLRIRQPENRLIRRKYIEEKMAKYKSHNLFVEQKSTDFFDWSIFLLTILLVTCGLISIYSATFDSGMSVNFYRQMVLAGVGTAIMVATTYIPERWIYINALPMYAISLLLLVIVLKFGKTTYGTTGWLAIGGFSLQPAELMKFSTVLMVANHLSKRGTDIATLRDLFTVGAYICVPVLLIALQPDIGTASVFGALFLGVLLWAGFDIYLLWFVVSMPLVMIASLTGTAGFVISVSAYSIIAALFRRNIAKTMLTIGIVFAIGYFSPVLVDNLADHQQKRIHTFLNPEDDPRGIGYNVIQSVMAVGSGGFTGKGFLQGTQTQLRYIPAQWTDFIFCVPTEEFGFLGGSAVILLLCGLLYRMVTVAKEVSSPFGGLVCASVAVIFFYHSIINIGMAIGVVPVMGIPLPFMSYGGSSLVVNMAMVGLVLNANRTHKKSVYMRG